VGSDLGNTPDSEGREVLFFFLNALLVSLDAIENALSLLFTGLHDIVVGEPSLVDRFMRLVLWVFPSFTALRVLLGALITAVLPGASPMVYLLCSMIV
jgi:hypothetical protein